MSAQVYPLITVADLEALPDDDNRYELIEGELFVSRSPTLTHQRTIGNLFQKFVFYLVKNPIGEVIVTPGVIFNQYNSVIPDLVFFSNKRAGEIATGKHIEGAPELAIEILSPGAENRRRDRILKRQVYSKFGMQEYWIADPENRSIEVYRLRDGILDLVATLADTDELTSPLLPGFSCQVNEIFSSL